MDLSQPVLDKDGKQVKGRINELDDEGENKISVKKFIVKDALIQALLKEEEEKTEEQINERYDLFMKIRDVEEIDFEDADKVLLMKLLIEKFDVLVCGQIFKQF